MAQNKPNIDNELILQIVGYNAEAFKQLFNRYSPSIYGLIKEIISNPKLAESVLINVFSVFLKRLEYFNTTSSNVYTYLTLLTRNISIDVLKRMKFVEDIPIYSDIYEIEFILPNLSKEIVQIDLDERYMWGEKIKSYKAQLTEVQNLLLSLIYFEGLNEEEIAKRLNVPMVTVRQKVLGIMDSLHQQYTGITPSNNNNKAVLELIKLEAIGFLSAEERMMLSNLKENDPDFLWKELGEFQNLTALISATIPEQPFNKKLDDDLQQVFTQILLQDGEVEYPIIPSEIPIPEPEIPKQINLKTEVKEIQQKSEPKTNGFQLKFREPDPTELNILRKLDRTEEKHSTPVVVNKTNTERLPNAAKVAETKPDVVIKRIVNSPSPKEIIKTELKEENKIAESTPVVSAPNIINDDPSILIEEPKPAAPQTEQKHVSRLTPTSSINLDDIIRKDNNPPIKRNTLVENSRLSNPIQSKLPLPDLPKQEANPIDLPKEVIENKTTVNKTIIQTKPDITFKVNQVPKEFKEELRKVEKIPTPVKAKAEQVQSEKFEIKIKSNEPPKEIKPTSINITKTNIEAAVKADKPVQTEPEIKIQPIEQPREISKTFTASAPVVKPTVEKTNAPRPVTTVETTKQNEQIKLAEKPAQQITQPKIVSSVENKVVTPKNEKLNSLKIEDAEKLSSLFKSKEKKDEPVKHENSTSNKTGLKIRETKFVEDEIKPEKASTNSAQIDEIKSVVENIIKDKHLTGSLTVEEVIAKLNEEKKKNQTETVLETESVSSSNDYYEEELNKIQKKRKVGIIVTAALFFVVAVTGIFIYMKFQPDTLKAANDTKPNKPQSFVAQQVEQKTTENQNIALTETTELTDEKVVAEENKGEEIKEEEKPTTENQIKISPITNNPNTLDESYTTINPSNQNKENNQTAAAKTETTNPPKENKINEKETSVFVAVEEMPELVGGLKQLQTKIKYPEIAKRTGVEGKVYVKAVVDENGNVISASTLKGIGAGCDEAAIDAVKNSKFTPGKQRGKNVKVEVTIPIVFKK